MGQVFKFDDVQARLAPHRSKKIVFTNGCFDLLHVGHVRYLKEARALGDYLVVGINSDASVKRLKGPARPIQNENDRAEILSSLLCVDAVVIFPEDTASPLIEQVRPNIFVKGGDWTVDKILEAPTVQAYGGKVMSLQFIEGKSTTKLIEKAQASEP